MRRSRFIACSGRATAAFAYSQKALQWLLCMLSQRQSFLTPPIVAGSKNLFSKKHSFVNGEIQLREASKFGDKKILILVYLSESGTFWFQVTEYDSLIESCHLHS